MIEIRLGDYVKIKTGKLNANAQDENGEYPFFTCAKVISRINTYAYDCECVLVAGNGVLNAKYYNGKFNAYQRVYIIEVKNREELSTRFLYYFIDKYMEKLRDGSIGGIIQYIKLNHLTDITLSLPDLPTQNKIVALMDKASALVQKREESISQLDELLRAQFLEMFGDPILNPKKWKLESLSSIGKFQSGGTPSKKNKKYWVGDFPWVSPKDMKRELISDSLDHISESVFSETSLKKISKHNILIVVRGMILAHSFPVALNTREIAINQDMKAIELKSNYNPFFTLVCLVVMKDWILKFVSTAGHGTKKMSSESLDSLRIVSPPIKLQNQFETIYHNIQAQKETLIQSKSELEHLYNSLLQEAFRGEIEVPKEDVKKKDSIMPEIKKKEGEKVDITKLDLATFLGIPDEITTTREKWIFDLISLDEFYQFLLKDNFKKEEAFTLGDIEEKLHNFFYHGGDMDFPNANWQQVIFKFIEAKPPLLEQIFDKETATVKLKLTDETFKA